MADAVCCTVGRHSTPHVYWPCDESLPGTPQWPHGPGRVAVVRPSCAFLASGGRACFGRASPRAVQWVPRRAFLTVGRGWRVMKGGRSCREAVAPARRRRRPGRQDAVPRRRRRRALPTPPLRVLPCTHPPPSPPNSAPPHHPPLHTLVAPEAPPPIPHHHHRPAQPLSSSGTGGGGSARPQSPTEITALARCGSAAPRPSPRPPPIHPGPPAVASGQRSTATGAGAGGAGTAQNLYAALHPHAALAEARIRCACHRFPVRDR